MSFNAEVFRVFIASPSDTGEQRKVIKEAVHRWTDDQALHRGVVLLPWMWETSAVSDATKPAQEAINGQGLDDADIVIAVFHAHVGRAALNGESGTVEELDRAVELGKRVHLYFSTAAVPQPVDGVQLQQLTEYKTRVSQTSLFGEFGDDHELERKIRSALEHDVAALVSGNSLPSQSVRSKRFKVSLEKEREQVGFDKRGKMKYRTQRWLEVRNLSELPAEQVVIESIGGQSVPLHDADRPTTIESGQVRSYTHLGYSAGDAYGDKKVRITWVEDGESKSEEYTVG